MKYIFKCEWLITSAVQAGLYTCMHINNMYVYKYIKCAVVDMLVNDLIMPCITAYHITEYVEHVSRLNNRCHGHRETQKEAKARVTSSNFSCGLSHISDKPFKPEGIFAGLPKL
jgi:hypothetical protein